MDHFLEFYSDALHILAKITVHTLEIIGILIVISGTLKVLIHRVKRLKNKEVEHQNAVIALGRSLSLALEFKMGAEIVNTVIVRELKELLILGIITLLILLLVHRSISCLSRLKNASLKK